MSGNEDRLADQRGHLDLASAQGGVAELTLMTQKTKIVDKIKEDLAHYASREHIQVNPAFVARMLLLTPGFQFVFAWRIQEALFRVPLVGRILRRIVWWFSCLLFGSEIALAANVDGGLYIPHPYGIVVGASDIGKRVTLLQHITIGRKDHSDRGRPRIEDGASLMAGCVVLGSITIGSNSSPANVNVSLKP